MQSTADAIKALLDTKPDTVIAIHQGPDGDAIGSALAWSGILKKLGINSSIIAPDSFPEFLAWMPGADQIIIFDKQEAEGRKAVDQARLICCLDFNAPDRMSHLEQFVVNAAQPIAVIDHHQQPAPFAQLYYTDPEACSTAEMVYRLVHQLNLAHLIDSDIAMCLYTGLITDTGSFRYPSVTPEVMRMAANLMATGFNHSAVYHRLFDSNSEDMTRLRGYALSEKLVVMKEQRTAYIWLSDAELKRFNYRKGDTEGLVNQALAIKGIRLAALITEGDGLVKLSLRSHGNLNVNKLAREHFEGGGHVNAAGGRSRDTMKNTVAKFEQVIKAMSAEIVNQE